MQELFTAAIPGVNCLPIKFRGLIKRILTRFCGPPYMKNTRLVCICFHVNSCKGFCALSRLVQDLYLFHAVNTMGNDFLLFTIIGQQIIIVFVKRQFVGTDYVGGSLAAFHLGILS